ncbi:putative late blight resistance protein homolog R1B-16 [Lycium ferocissimum]|uniref:putative late blight resistance protein homolog R1B-16 n=1 Tax=Lycium ferocissimum TaxID=112874 RepID=UPI002815D234|nr:putative late blight resistance protein homolog R1B-16 [Lycium ferocissimum]
MAETVVSFLLENLLQLLSENVELIKGVGNEFKNLLEEVERLRAFLDDAAQYHSDSNLWDQLGKDIQKTVHKAEDVIDKFLVQSKLHREKNKLERIFDVGHLNTVRELAKEIKGIHEKVKKLREDNKDAFQPRPVLELPSRGVPEQGPSLEDAEVVGFDEEANKVMSRLVEGSEDLDTIPVVGMPGLGKTTLARKIYNDSKLSYEFFTIIWVYVGQEYKRKDIFFKILKFFTRRIEDYQDEDMDALAKVIGGFIKKGGRCLICLDDVWKPEVIDDVKKVFPENNKGHRIMMTTRHRNVATYANPDPHDLKFLTVTESFELLVKRVFGKGSCRDELVGLGEKIAKKCDGVPLVVVVIAGALKGRLDKKHWERVEKNVVHHLYNDNEDSCLKFVEMSYHHLPREVQTCFLYCGVFPRGFDIPSWKLIRLWIAEGLIKPQETYTLEEIAEYYLNDLINRNLVILMQKRSDGQIKTCRLHDMLHQFCKKEACNKLLFQEVCLTPDQSIPSMPDPKKCRRLCIQPSNLKDLLSENPSIEHVRSLYCFSSKEKQLGLSPNDVKLIHQAFPLIRVLDVESFKFIFSKTFHKLFHLRYIAISGDFMAIPLTFGKFWNLQTLIINTSTSAPTLDVEADIWNMLQLRHLHTNIPAKLPPPATTTGKASCLQTLSLVAPESCEKDVLAKACNLRKLSIRGQMAAFLGAYKDTGVYNLEELKCLEHLKLLNDVLYMNKTPHLPPTFSKLVHTVKKLTLTNTRFAWSEAEKLGKLESLEVLKIKENAFAGASWKPKTGFSALQVLWIERSELESWEASARNFSILRHLVLISCDKLEAVPFELADIPNLQEMRLENTSKAVNSAKYIRESKTSKCKNFKLSIFPPENESKAAQ